MQYILEGSRRADVVPHLTCNAAAYRFRDIRVKILDFGGHLGHSRRETCPGPISTIVSNFTPRYLSLSGQKKSQNNSKLNIRLKAIVAFAGQHR